jgi:sphinganine-1-phosphate aldolase
MTAKMLNAGDDAVGSLTCGGTESIIMAIKAYKEMAKAKGITEPEMICPVSAHAAFAKVHIHHQPTILEYLLLTKLNI